MLSYWRAYVDLIEQPGGWWLALLPVVILLCVWFLLVQVGLARIGTRRTVSEPLDERRLDAALHAYAPRNFADPAVKGFKAERRVVDFGPTWRTR